FALLAPEGLRGSDGRAVDLSAMFEARVFGAKAELRWLNDPSGEGKHRAVILAEEDLVGTLGDPWGDPERIVVIEALPQTYLLWGEGTEPRKKGKGRPLATGWSELGTARIGGLAVPVPGVHAAGQRVLLRTVEYLAEADHGNVVVQDERL